MVDFPASHVSLPEGSNSEIRVKTVVFTYFTMKRDIVWYSHPPTDRISNIPIRRIPIMRWIIIAWEWEVLSVAQNWVWIRTPDIDLDHFFVCSCRNAAVCYGKAPFFMVNRFTKWAMASDAGKSPGGPWLATGPPPGVGRNSWSPGALEGGWTN